MSKRLEKLKVGYKALSLLEKLELPVAVKIRKALEDQKKQCSEREKLELSRFLFKQLN
jgi:hypothetical protein